MTIVPVLYVYKQEPFQTLTDQLTYAVDALR